MPKVLILSSADTETNHQLNDKFVAELNQQFGNDFTVEWQHYDNIMLQFSQGQLEATLLPSRTSFKEYSFVFFKSYYRYSEQAIALSEYLRAAGISYLCSELDHYISFSKLTQYARLAAQQMPIPPTVFIPRKLLGAYYEALVQELGSPFICKASNAKGGDANYLIKEEGQLHEALQTYPEAEFVCQRFIPNDSDLRILVIGDEIDLVIQRRRADDSTHLNNTSQGASAAEVPVAELPEAVQTLALKAAKIMRREVAGVDIMLEAGSGTPYILEINASPQVASGAFTDSKVEKYGKFFKKMLKIS